MIQLKQYHFVMLFLYLKFPILDGEPMLYVQAFYNAKEYRSHYYCMIVQLPVRPWFPLAILLFKFLRKDNNMKKFILLTSVIMMSFSIISESQADCATGSIACGDDCAADDGKSTCHWEIDSNGKLSFTGSGAMKDRKVINGVVESSAWSKYRGKISTVDINGISYVGAYSFINLIVKSVSFGNSVTSIGAGAFASNQLTSLTLPDSITSIGGSAFSSNKLTSVVLPDSIKSIGGWAFADNKLTSVVLPDSLHSLGDASFHHNQLSEAVIPDTVVNELQRVFGTDIEMLKNLRIECKGSKDSCQKINKLLQKYGYRYDYETGFLYMDLSHRLFDIGQENCDSTNFYWNGKECIREPDVTKRTCCADVCKDMGGWCNRIRYTPAEAAQVLRDDDKNEVTITFRK